MRIFEEKGSMTLLGVWLLGCFIGVSTLAFVLSQKESQNVILAQRNLHLQLMAESLLAEEQILLEQDFAQALKIASRVSKREITLGSGVRDGMSYRLNAKNVDGKIALAAWVKYDSVDKSVNMYALQWRFVLDKENEKLVLERIG